MSQFVAGQWVECVDAADNLRIKTGGVYRIAGVFDNMIVLDIENKWERYFAERFRPVSWQVGRTYRTTLEGVTATISVLDSDGDLWGNDSREHKHAPKWCWSGTTGILYELKDDKAAPHLTPYLADEQTPAVETTETSKPAEPPPAPSRYHRTINGATLDLYDVAEAYGLESHRIFHAVKKLILAGRRGHKDREQDLREAIVSIESELQKMKGGAS